MAQGGYPALEALPEGVTTQSQLIQQIDAADRAFLRHGIACDGEHHVEDGQDHPLLQSFKRDHPGSSGKKIRKDFLLLLKQDLYDTVHVYSRH